MSLENSDSRPRRKRAARIEIPGDVLVSDEEFCIEVLAGATRRSAQKLDAEGCPFVIVNNQKYRPLEEGRRWLAARIKRKGRPPTRRRVR
jgi:hypothetical protein